MHKKIWIGVAIAIAILFLAIPYLLSVPPLKSILIAIVERKINATISIDRIRFSWFGPQKLEGVHIATPEISGEISELTSNVPFWSLASMGRSIETINASGTTKVDGQTGQFSIQGKAPSREVFEFNFSMTRMPTAIVDRFANAKGLAEAALGPNFDASGFAKYQNDAGQLDLDLSSPKGSASVRADFSPTAITLRGPLQISLILTPELTKALTRSSLSIQSIDPARLRIEPKGFSLPRPYSLQGVKIEQASLDLKRVRIQNAEFLAPLNKFLKARISTKQVDAWFTSADFKLSNGLLSLGRVDALIANSIHLCAWGNANLGTERLDMVLGIPSDTLASSLGIRNLSSTYVLHIPVTGTFQSPKYDTGAATSLVASTVTKNITKGLFGGLGEKLAGSPKEQKSPPPKRPFPWER